MDLLIAFCDFFKRLFTHTHTQKYICIYLYLYNIAKSDAHNFFILYSVLRCLCSYGGIVPVTLRYLIFLFI